MNIVFEKVLNPNACTRELGKLGLDHILSSEVYLMN